MSGAMRDKKESYSEFLINSEASAVSTLWEHSTGWDFKTTIQQSCDHLEVVVDEDARQDSDTEVPI